MHIELEGLHNTRDLGGMSAADGRAIKSGLLYRSDQLFFAAEGDLRTLAGLGVGVVFDLRSVSEREEKPDPAIEGARNVHLPIIEDVRRGITRSSSDDENLVALLASGRADEAVVDRHMQAMYREFVTEPCANAQYARFVTELVACVAQGKAVLWHCTAGKDRAGFATAIVLWALGVSRETIMADYLQTNAFLAETVDALVAQFGGKLPSDAARAALRRFFVADASYLESAFSAADERFGSFDAFQEGALGITSDVRARMRDLLLV